MKKSILMLIFVLVTGLLYAQDISGTWTLSSVELKKVKYGDTDTVSVSYSSSLFKSLDTGLFESFTLNVDGTCLMEGEYSGTYSLENQNLIVNILPIPHSYLVQKATNEKLIVSKEFWSSDESYIPYHYKAECSYSKKR